VRERLTEQLDDVLVVHGVEDQAAISTRPYETHAAKKAKLVRYCRLADAYEGRDVADAKLARGKGVKDADTSRVAEDAERVRQGLDRRRGHQEVAPRLSAIGRAIKVRRFARVSGRLFGNRYRLGGV
jgi:hypothetical protein